VGLKLTCTFHNTKKDSTNQAEPLCIVGARDENRTRTPIRARDFKSLLIPKDIISLHFP
jgi:hypothetical protein